MNFSIGQKERGKAKNSKNNFKKIKRDQKAIESAQQMEKRKKMI